MRSIRLVTLLVLALQSWSGGAFAHQAEQLASGGKKRTVPVVSLLDYLHAHTQTESVDEIEKHIPKYNRLQHFGRWVDVDRDCQTTMTEVLIRDADPSEPLEYRDKDQCALTKGRWNDPYTGAIFRTKTALQIDHVVPLKNAYVSGAHAWSQARRCTYGNYMGNGFHLLAVSAHENMSKGAQGPESYLPPNEAYLCQYVAIWMRIKAIWELEVTKDEIAKIEDVIAARRCPSETYMMKKAELANERNSTNNIPSVCAAPVAPPTEASRSN